MGKYEDNNKLLREWLVSGDLDLGKMTGLRFSTAEERQRDMSDNLQNLPLVRQLRVEGRIE